MRLVLIMVFYGLASKTKEKCRIHDFVFLTAGDPIPSMCAILSEHPTRTVAMVCCDYTQGQNCLYHRAGEHNSRRTQSADRERHECRSAEFFPWHP